MEHQARRDNGINLLLGEDLGIVIARVAGVGGDHIMQSAGCETDALQHGLQVFNDGGLVAHTHRHLVIVSLAVMAISLQPLRGRLAPAARRPEPAADLEQGVSRVLIEPLTGGLGADPVAQQALHRRSGGGWLLHHLHAHHPSKKPNLTDQAPLGGSWPGS